MSAEWEALPDGQEAEPPVFDRFMCSCLTMVVFDGSSWAFTVPAMLPYSVSIGMTVEQTTRVFAIRQLLLMFTGPGMARLADRWGAKSVMVIGATGTAVAIWMQVVSFAAAASLGAVPALWLLNGGRILSGLFCNPFSVASSAIAHSVEDRFTGVLKKRQNAVTYATRFSMPACNAIGGALAHLGLLAPFLCAATGASIALSAAATMPRVSAHAPAKRPGGGAPRGGLGRLLADPCAYAMFLTSMSTAGVMASLMVLLPVLLSVRSPEALGLHDDAGQRANAAWVGLTALVSGVMFAPGIALYWLLARRVPHFLLVLGSKVLELLAIILVAVSPVPWEIAASMALMGLGMGGVAADRGGTFLMVMKYRHPEMVAQAMASGMLGMPAGVFLLPYLAVRILGEQGEGRLPAYGFLLAFSAVNAVTITAFKYFADYVIEPEMKRRGPGPA